MVSTSFPFPSSPHWEPRTASSFDICFVKNRIVWGSWKSFKGGGCGICQDGVSSTNTAKDGTLFNITWRRDASGRGMRMLGVYFRSLVYTLHSASLHIVVILLCIMHFILHIMNCILFHIMHRILYTSSPFSSPTCHMLRLGRQQRFLFLQRRRCPLVPHLLRQLCATTQQLPTTHSSSPHLPDDVPRSDNTRRHYDNGAKGETASTSFRRRYKVLGDAKSDRFIARNALQMIGFPRFHDEEKNPVHNIGGKLAVYQTLR